MDNPLEEHFVPVFDYAKKQAAKPYKHTFLNTSRVLVGINVLAPGQEQPIHDHPDQDKFYFVLEGTGWFTVGDETMLCGPGVLVLAPAGIEHGVHNPGPQRLVFLTTIAPGIVAP
jgi:mannose-6-phosphate isomerase-like protein (cupin superfamily)